MVKEEPRVGGYICHCGGNISDTVDVEKVRKAAAKMEGVKSRKRMNTCAATPGKR